MKNELNVKVKKIKYFDGKGGIGFNADVWINNTKCFHVHDSAHGGCFDYYNHSDEPKVKDLITRLEDHIESLPPKEWKTKESKTISIKYDMDMFINDMLEKIEKAKDEKKMKKFMIDHILIGVPNAMTYSKIKLSIPLSNIPTDQLQLLVDKIIDKYCTDGVIILNDNLEERGIKIIYFN